MRPTELDDGLFIIPGFVNVYLLDLPRGLTLIDTGFPRDTKKILNGLGAFGKRIEDVQHILLTHAHPDHIGGAHALQSMSGAQVYAHKVDAPLIESGGPSRPLVSAPGLRNKIVVALLRRLNSRTSPVRVTHRLEDGSAMPFADDLVAVHIPGHCAGQVAFHWQKGSGVLFAADSCISRKSMVLAAAQEDVREARRSLTKLAGLRFETACFGHGPPIMGKADRRFRDRWS